MRPQRIETADLRGALGHEGVELVGVACLVFEHAGGARRLLARVHEHEHLRALGALLRVADGVIHHLVVADVVHPARLLLMRRQPKKKKKKK
jgi:hypothetical protein